MPRINIEESVWSDARFAVLQVYLASEIPALDPIQIRPLAIGWLVSAWKTAQRYWLDDGSPIPAAIWTKGKFPQSIIDSDLARIDEHGNVWLAGISDAFDWIVKSIENGKKGGRPKKSNDLINPTKPNETQLNLLKPSSSSSSSSSLGDQIQKKEKKEEEVPPAVAVASRPKKQKADEPTPTYEVWKEFADQYHEAWNVMPPSNAKNFRKCKELVDAVGVEDAKKIAAHYAKSCNEWYVKNGHDLIWMVKDYMRLHKEVNIGIKFTKEVVKDLAAKENFDNHEKYNQNKMNIYDDDEFEEYCKQIAKKEMTNVLPETDQRSLG